jgi:hypothetical protein
MPTIAISAEHRQKFNQLFAEWQREYGATIQGMPPMSVAPDGRDVYSWVPEAMLPFLQKASVKYELISN